MLFLLNKANGFYFIEAFQSVWQSYKSNSVVLLMEARSVLSKLFKWSLSQFLQEPDYNYRAEVKKLIPHLEYLDGIPASQTAVPPSSKMNEDWLIIKESIKEGGLPRDISWLGTSDFPSGFIFQVMKCEKESQRASWPLQSQSLIAEKRRRALSSLLGKWGSWNSAWCRFKWKLFGAGYQDQRNANNLPSVK